jgi:hypothetical protein
MALADSGAISTQDERSEAGEAVVAGRREKRFFTQKPLYHFEDSVRPSTVLSRALQAPSARTKRNIDCSVRMARDYTTVLGAQPSTW